MTIRITNATFESASTDEFTTVDDAFRAAIMSGIDIAAGEIRSGLERTIVQIAVDVAAKKEAARGAVAISTARFHDVAAGGTDTF